MTIPASFMGLPDFLLYMALSLVFMWVFIRAYTSLTPYNEWKLIKEGQNLAAALALSGSLVGFTLALASAAKNSVSLIDFAIWAAIAMATQLVAFVLIRFVYMRKIVARIGDNEVPAGAMSGAISLSVGLMNAAAMTY